MDRTKEHDQSHLVSNLADQIAVRAEREAMLTAAATADRHEILHRDQLLLDEAFQLRDELDKNAVQMYSRRYKVGAPMPPVEVARVGNQMVLIDGWHRLEAMRIAGIDTFTANVRDLDTLDEARWQGGIINSQHGVKLTRNEREKRFALYVRMGKCFAPGKPRRAEWCLSYRKMGIEFGVSPHTIKKQMKKVNRRLHDELEALNGAEEAAGGGTQHRVTTKLTPEEIVKTNLNNVRNGLADIAYEPARGNIIAALTALLAELKNDKVVDF